MSKVMVHRFRVWDSVSDTMKMSSRLATLDAIRDKAHGEPVGPAIEINSSDLGGEIDGMTIRDYVAEGGTTPSNAKL